MPVATLKVNSFSAEQSQFVKVGNSPYLHTWDGENPPSSNYIYSNANNTDKYYLFETIPQNVQVTKATLEMFWKTNLWIGAPYLYIWINGEQKKSLTSPTDHTIWGWTSWDVSDVFSTGSDVNAASLEIQAGLYGSWTITIDAVRLIVEYTSAPTTVQTTLSVSYVRKKKWKVGLNTVRLIDYDETWTEWDRTGQTPYLDKKDYPNNYVSTTMAFDLTGFYYFEKNIPSTFFVKNAKFCINARSGEEIIIQLVKTYPSESTLQWMLQPNSLSFNWHTLDVTSFFSTPEELNSAKLYFMLWDSYEDPVPAVDAAHFLVTLDTVKTVSTTFTFLEKTKEKIKTSLVGIYEIPRRYLIDIEVQNPEDDAEETPGFSGGWDLYWDTDYMEVHAQTVEQHLAYWNMGIRWEPHIPQGATIIYASIATFIHPDVGDACHPACTIYAHATDDAPDFDDLSNIHGRTRTSAYKVWCTDTTLGPGVHWVDVTEILQEIVNREGWSPGNGVAFLFIASKEPEHEDRAYRCCQIGGDHSYASRLKVKYMATLLLSVISKEALNLEDDYYAFAKKKLYKFRTTITHSEGIQELDYVDWRFIKDNLTYTVRWLREPDQFTIVQGAGTIKASGSSTLVSSETVRLDYDVEFGFQNTTGVYDVEVYAKDLMGSDVSSQESNYFIVWNSFDLFNFTASSLVGVGKEATISGELRYVFGVDSYDFPSSIVSTVEIYSTEGEKLAGCSDSTFTCYWYPPDIGPVTVQCSVSIIEGPDKLFSDLATVTADRINVYYQEVTDERVNVSDTVTFQAKATLEYLGETVGLGDVMNAGQGSMSWNDTEKVWQLEYSKDVVSSETFCIVEAKHGQIDAFTITVSNPEVIWDKLTVSWYPSASLLLAPSYVTVTTNIYRMYDSSSVSSFQYVVNRDGVAWQTISTNTFEDYSGSAVNRVYDLSEVEDMTFGLTSFIDPPDIQVSWLEKVSKLLKKLWQVLVSKRRISSLEYSAFSIARRIVNVLYLAKSVMSSLVALEFNLFRKVSVGISSWFTLFGKRVSSLTFPYLLKGLKTRILSFGNLLKRKISNAKELPYLLRTKISQHLNIRSKLLEKIVHFTDICFNSLKAVRHFSSLAYNTLRKIQQQTVPRYTVFAAVRETLSLLVNIAGIIRQWLTVKHFTKALASSLESIEYRVRELKRSVLDKRYSLKALETRALSMLNFLREKVEVNIEVVSKIFERVMNSLLSVFSAIGRVKRFLSTSYLVGYIASRVLAYGYTVFSVARRVFSSTYWNLALLKHLLVQKHMLRNRLEKSSIIFHNVLKKLEQITTGLYASLGKVESSFRMLYSYFLKLQVTFPILYHVGYFLTKTLKLVSSLIGKAESSLASLYTLLAKRTGSVSFSFTVRRVLREILSQVYTLPGKILQTLASVYRSRVFVRGKSLLQHSIRNFQSGLFSLEHNLRVSVKSFFRVVHGLGGVIESLFTIGYTVGRVFLECISSLTRVKPLSKLRRSSSVFRMVKEKLLYKLRKRILKR